MGILENIKLKLGLEKKEIKKVIEKSQRIVELPLEGCIYDTKTGEKICKTREKLIVVDKKGKIKTAPLK